MIYPLSVCHRLFMLFLSDKRDLEDFYEEAYPTMWHIAVDFKIVRY
jgi:hypothetical protein